MVVKLLPHTSSSTCNKIGRIYLLQLQRELNDKVGRLSQATGVFLKEHPPIVQHNSSKDLIVDFRSMLQRVESLNSSQGVD